MVLIGLRGVGKTVLLNAMRSAAVRRGWGTGKLEARPGQSLRRPLAAALHLAVRELAHPQDDAVRQVLGVVKAFAQREPAGAKPTKQRWSPGIDVPAAIGRADSGDTEIDLVELLTDVAGLAARHRARHRGVHRRDAGHRPGRRLGAVRRVPRDLAAGPAAGRRRRRAAARAGGAVGGQVVLRAAVPVRPHRPARASAADVALRVPARDEGADFTDDALAAMYQATGGYPYFVQAYGKVAWDVAPRTPITADDVAVAAPVAESELAVGFFGSRYERATPSEREYLRAMAEVAVPVAPDEPVATAAVAEALDRSPQSVSPARDALLEEGTDLFGPARHGSLSPSRISDGTCAISRLDAQS